MSLALEAADLGDGDRGAEERILAGALDDAAPPRIAGDVHHRGEGPVDAHGAGLARGDGLTALDRLGVPRRRHRDRYREDRAQPVDDVEAEQHRDAEPIAVEREPLEPVDLGRVGHEQQRSDLAPPAAPPRPSRGCASGSTSSAGSASAPAGRRK